MSLLSYFRRLIIGDSSTVRVDSYSSAAGERVEETDVLALSTAWACVNLTAGIIGSLPLAVYRADAKGNRTIARDHPLYRLLHNSPNAEQTSLDFWEGAAASIELKGNAVALKTIGSSGAVVSLVPMAWDYTSVRRLDSGHIQYEYRGDKYRPEEVLHIRGFGGDPLGGLSTIAYGAATFGLAKAINKATGSTFKNGVRPSGVLSTEQQLNAAQRVEAEGLLGEKFRGAMNSGTPMLLDKGLKWLPVTMNPEDAQMLQSRAFSVEEICRMFATPPHMVGHTQNSTSWGTGLEQQTLGYQKFSLTRRLKRIEKALEQQLLTPADIVAGITIEFNLEGLLRGDSLSRARFYQIMTMIGAFTINEVRAKENLPPVEGGDVPRTQMQNVPLTADDIATAISEQAQAA